MLDVSTRSYDYSAIRDRSIFITTISFASMLDVTSRSFDHSAIRDKSIFHQDNFICIDAGCTYALIHT